MKCTERRQPPLTTPQHPPGTGSESATGMYQEGLYMQLFYLQWSYAHVVLQPLLPSGPAPSIGQGRAFRQLRSTASAPVGGDTPGN